MAESTTARKGPRADPINPCHLSIKFVISGVIILIIHQPRHQEL